MDSLAATNGRQERNGVSVGENCIEILKEADVPAIEEAAQVTV